MISALQEMCAVCIFQGIYFQSHQLGTHGRLGHGNLQIFPLNVMRMQTQVQVQISIKIQIQMKNFQIFLFYVMRIQTKIQVQI